MKSELKDFIEIFKGWFFEGIGLILVGITLSHFSFNNGNRSLALIGSAIALLGALLMGLSNKNMKTGEDK